MNKKEYLDCACGKIRDKKTRARVREEMESHIEERAEEYRREGFPAEEAEQKAVEQMGSAERVSEDLGVLHSFFPKRHIFRAIVFLIFGIVFSSFIVDIEGTYVRLIVNSIGSALILFALLLLKGGNKKLFAAFWIYVAFFAVSVVFKSVQMTELAVADEDILFACDLFFGCGDVAAMFLVGYGLADCGEGKAALHGRLFGWLSVVGTLAIYFAPFVSVAVAWVKIILLVLLNGDMRFVV